jgi:hypothetical protein
MPAFPVKLFLNIQRRIDMSTAFKSIRRGLLEAIEHAEGCLPEARVHRPRPVNDSNAEHAETPEDRRQKSEDGS